jgi:hypothetical protein
MSPEGRLHLEDGEGPVARVIRHIEDHGEINWRVMTIPGGTILVWFGISRHQSLY